MVIDEPTKVSGPQKAKSVKRGWRLGNAQGTGRLSVEARDVMVKADEIRPRFSQMIGE